MASSWPIEGPASGFHGSRVLGSHAVRMTLCLVTSLLQPLTGLMAPMLYAQFVLQPELQDTHEISHLSMLALQSQFVMNTWRPLHPCNSQFV